ncbi:endonuclease V [Flavobacterium suaedae]|uniref:Endonuclease V n=1 Tax=Flavobacterium suaedae TaxID=1767027 RepID=A0ABQ1JHA8_9FLAO|nr:deoxyribonuclease V [Flavobacterium suaedae]GGB66307.1 endonuclease V [Flavobacterium suaedae]
MINYNNLSIPEATAIQEKLRKQLLLITKVENINTIAGADISHNKNTDTIYAGIVILSYPQMVLQSYSLVVTETKFPYVPQYLAFREVPALLEAWKQLPDKPDITVLDGQGITHQRRMGIASHFGIMADCATIGCAKKMLFGTHSPVGEKKYSSSPIYINNDITGYALRTKDNVKPVFISPGHKVSVPDSLNIMKKCVLRHRIPEPTRRAHEIVNKFRLGNLKEGVHFVDIQKSLFD